MRLSHLLKDIFPLPPEADKDIASLVLDSRKLKPQDVFIALTGSRLDGREYIPDAIARGAAAILLEGAKPALTTQQQIPIISLPVLQRQVGELAARFYDYPATQLGVIGVTGTSGKTSCTHFIAQLLHSLQGPCGLIGTLGNGIYGDLGEVGLTTPDAITLQATLSQFVKMGAKSVAMEVSSHSIHQERVRGVDFTLGIFTNLTQDHLDYHGNMDTYAAVKRRLFDEWPMQHAIINADDAHGQRWITELSAQKSVYAFSTHQMKAKERMIYAEQIALTLEGISAYIHTPWGEGELRLPLIGEFNLSNSLAALTALCLQGLPFNEVLQAMATLQAVPGRMQILGGGAKPLVVVDYAHKPDALLKVLQALRAHTKGRICCVFGCGGERDHLKRPLMGQIAKEWADRVIVTNDNPRHEDPETVAADILQGITDLEGVSVLLDRSKAIENSIQWAKPADCILIAGKGAEHYQQIGDEKIPFDDVLEVKQYLE